MTDTMKFRTAINGFHRGDVVAFIESMATEHQEALRQLRREQEQLQSERDALKAELAAAQKAAADANAALEDAALELTVLKEQDEALQEQIISLSEQGAELELARQAAQSELEQTRQALSEQQSDTQEPAQTLESMELSAYRRAEAAERSAMLRAGRLSERVGELCETARTRLADSGDEISALTSDLHDSLSRLQEAFAELNLIFDETQNGFDALELPDETDGADSSEE